VIYLLAGVLVGALLRHWIEIELRKHQPDNEGVEFMYIVKDDHEDVEYRIGEVTAQDAEGNAVDVAGMNVSVVSSDPAVVKVTSRTPTEGKLSFGKPGNATVAATINAPSGQQIVRTANFVVTTGDVALIAGGNLEIDGLTEAPEVPSIPDAPADEVGETV
jgi:hypothetical protein